MKAYNFNQEDFTFCGVTECQIDPVRSSKTGRVVYLLPANSTFVAPPMYDAEKEIPVWNGEGWVLVSLHEPDVPDVPDEPGEEPSVWDELDAAYQKGVNTAYDE